MLRDHLGGPALPIATLSETNLAGAIAARQDDVNPAGGLDFLPAVVEVAVSDGESPPRYAPVMATEPVSYWIEVAKRAYTDGDDRALPYLDTLVRREREGPRCRMSSHDLPHWLFDLWLDHYMHDLATEEPVPVRAERRRHSEDFRAIVVGACMGLAAVAVIVGLSIGCYLIFS